MPPHGRYAPSPSGPLHLGNLRTALLAWLWARAQGARFLLRVDDLDAGRSRERFVAEQIADLRALGLDWDAEAPRSSRRGDAYAGALAGLEARGLVYPCFCTRAEIREAARAPHGPLPEGAYPGTCRALTRAERAAREAAGRPPALRVRAGGAVVEVSDELAGPVRGVVDDVVVRRNDGSWAYNLAVVVDDHDQDVGQVVRGADLLDTTPRQAWLHGRLGFGPLPRYAHVPLVLGPDGARLAKRHGAVTLADRLAQGRTPAQVRGELAASAGLCEPGEEPALEELVARFDPARVPRTRRSSGRGRTGRAACRLGARMAQDTAEIAARATAAGRLGIDTEFMGEGRYRPLLCLVQVAVPTGDGSTSDVVVLDPLAGAASTTGRWPACWPTPRWRSSCTPAARTARSCAGCGAPG
jgi:glutamyl-tRNA synthetase